MLIFVLVFQLLLCYCYAYKGGPSPIACWLFQHGFVVFSPAVSIGAHIQKLILGMRIGMVASPKHVSTCFHFLLI